MAATPTNVAFENMQRVGAGQGDFVKLTNYRFVGPGPEPAEGPNRGGCSSGCNTAAWTTPAQARHAMEHVGDGAGEYVQETAYKYVGPGRGEFSVVDAPAQPAAASGVQASGLSSHPIFSHPAVQRASVLCRIYGIPVLLTVLALSALWLFTWALGVGAWDEGRGHGGVEPRPHPSGGDVPTARPSDVVPEYSACLRDAVAAATIGEPVAAPHSVFIITLDHANYARYGFVLVSEPTVLVVGGVNGGLLQAWNFQHPTRRVLVGDRFVAVNGIRGDTNKMLDQLNQPEVFHITVLRAHCDPFEGGQPIGGPPWDEGQQAMSFAMYVKNLELAGVAGKPAVASAVQAALRRVVAAELGGGSQDNVIVHVGVESVQVQVRVPDGVSNEEMERDLVVSEADLCSDSAEALHAIPAVVAIATGPMEVSLRRFEDWTTTRRAPATTEHVSTPITSRAESTTPEVTTTPQTTSAPPPTTTLGTGGGGEGGDLEGYRRGLQVEFFTGLADGHVDWEDTVKGLTPSVVRAESNVDHPTASDRWEGVDFHGAIAARWWGFLVIKEPGSYTFQVSSNNIVKLTVDRQELLGGRIEAAGIDPMLLLKEQPTAELAAGAHRFSLTLLEKEAGEVLGIVCRYTGPDTGGVLVTIPEDAFRSAAAPSSRTAAAAPSPGALQSKFFASGRPWRPPAPGRPPLAAGVGLLFCAGLLAAGTPVLLLLAAPVRTAWREARPQRVMRRYETLSEVLGVDEGRPARPKSANPLSMLS